MRLDQCLAGLPQSIELVSSADETAPAASASEASALLGRWLEAAREQPSAAPCFNATGFPLDLSGRFDDTLLVAPEYKLSFQTAAKVASMTAVAWMQCRFGATSATAEAAAPPAYPGYTRLAMVREPRRAEPPAAEIPRRSPEIHPRCPEMHPRFPEIPSQVREPASRAISGYMQTASHYLQLLRLPPAGLRSCAAAWPAGLESISLDASLRDASTGAPPNGTSTWPRECHEAWATDAFTGAPKGDREPIIYLTQSELRATAGSSFLQALWELPAACRTISRPNGDLRRQWFCEGDECDVSTPCELPDATMVALLAHALSDAARTNMGGCAPMTFGGEHLWPQVRSPPDLRPISARSPPDLLSIFARSPPTYHRSSRSVGAAAAPGTFGPGGRGLPPRERRGRQRPLRGASRGGARRGLAPCRPAGVLVGGAAHERRLDTRARRGARRRGAAPSARVPLG